MLLSSSSNLKSVETVAEGIARSGASMIIFRCAHTYDLVEFPSALALAKRLEVLYEEKKEPVAIWAAGKRTK